MIIDKNTLETKQELEAKAREEVKKNPPTQQQVREVAEANAKWEAKYGHLERKVTSTSTEELIEVTDIAGVRVRKELTREQIERIKLLVAVIKDYGLQLEEIRAFRMANGSIGVTLLDGTDAEDPNKSANKDTEATDATDAPEEPKEPKGSERRHEPKVEEPKLEGISGVTVSNIDITEQTAPTAILDTAEELLTLMLGLVKSAKASGNYVSPTDGLELSRRRVITPDEERGILEDYQKGAKVEDIRARYDIGSSLMYTLLKKHKVSNRRQGESGRTLSEESQLSIVEDYQRGVKVTTIMKKHNVSTNLMYAVLSKHNISKRVKRSDNVALSEDKKSAILADYSDMSLTVKDIYAKHDINKHTLFNLLNKHNVPRRYKQK